MKFRDIKKTLSMHAHQELQREITLIELAPNPYYLFISICLVDMKVFAKFDEIPSMPLEDIKKTLSMHAYTKPLRMIKGNNSYRIGP